MDNKYRMTSEEFLNDANKSFDPLYRANITNDERDKISQLVAEEKETGFGTNGITPPGIKVKQKTSNGKINNAAFTDLMAIIFTVGVVGFVTVLTMLLYINGVFA